MEKESNGKIPFLDVLVERKEGRLSTRVYGKKTHTDRYINFSSHHHPQVKSGVISCLRNRAEKACDQEHLKTEMVHLKKTFKANGYPPCLILKGLHQQNRHPPQPSQDDTTSQEERPKLLYLPYVKGISEHIQRVCRQMNVRAVFRSRGTLRESLMRVKIPRPPLLKKGVVYKVPCMDCNSTYIGETGRNLKRLAEHRAAVKRGDTNNGIAVHAWEQQHRVDWDEACILVQEPRYWRRRVLEAIEIQKHAENSNLDCGLSLNLIWTPILSM